LQLLRSSTAATTLTDWFEIGPLPPQGPGWAPSLMPLIAGGAVLSTFAFGNQWAPTTETSQIPVALVVAG